MPISLDDLFYHYQSNIVIAGIDMNPDYPSLSIYIPKAMTNEYLSITKKKKLNPTVFWEELRFKERLYELLKKQQEYGKEVCDVLQHLNSVEAVITPHPLDAIPRFTQPMLLLSVEERG